MNKTNISEIQIVPEEYCRHVYESIDWKFIKPEMTDEERRFINGLIMFYQPKSVLEIGVSAGSGTLNLLNSLNNTDNTDWTLYSIDNATQVWHDPDLAMGCYAIEKYSDLLNNKWHLITGKDPADVMERIDTQFDFCIIDSDHRHPVEILNFISVLPRLRDGAIVVLHDISLYENDHNPLFYYMAAPRLLFSVICADKYVPQFSGYDTTSPNIAAFQVNDDTRKYCRNLFDILFFPWYRSIATKTYQNIRILIKKEYATELLDYFDESVTTNKSLLINHKYGIAGPMLAKDKLNENIVFYGAGNKMQEILEDFDFFDIDFNFPIWDINADKLIEIHGYPVSAPDYAKIKRNDKILIITIENKQIASEVKARFELLGYNAYHGLKSYYQN